MKELMSEYDMEMNFTLDGVKYPILMYLDREAKQELAYDILARTVYIDEETGLALMSPYYDVETMMLLIGAYTDIEVPDSFEDRLVMYDKIMSEGYPYFEDASQVLEIATKMTQNFIKVQDERERLSHSIKKMLPELMEKESLSDTITKGSGIVEFLMGTLKQATDKGKPSKGAMNLGKRKI